jgi:hypothetical protein
MDVTSCSLPYIEITFLREIGFGWTRGRAVADSNRGQPGVGELNKIT